MCVLYIGLQFSEKADCAIPFQHAEVIFVATILDNKKRNDTSPPPNLTTDLHENQNALFSIKQLGGGGGVFFI